VRVLEVLHIVCALYARRPPCDHVATRIILKMADKRQSAPSLFLMISLCNLAIFLQHPYIPPAKLFPNVSC
jgi:hypothetical protein